MKNQRKIIRNVNDIICGLALVIAIMFAHFNILLITVLVVFIDEICWGMFGRTTKTKWYLAAAIMGLIGAVGYNFI
ncbi:hypothetical protein [Fructilactobacillus fructivorans]|uniref:Uncharacterized protein n=1 Tax=Fructilactobacillus fructivorans TaxID=1614 RepID=A0A0C1PZJ4_9LACO|nr:hypothetical protein [Fructilactobacillus fructivorans]KID41093.1 hypothetical protein LfDm3_1239 [Fructilactobacillus fructivorans]MCT0151464.1 hypothetical protein [Fructilactobacillus fructivorans]MCT2866983.1 hypothetical protein [Fructilactobacillus fructivorans]MCT2869284.1 hypothetical protein [Fructilactobacillus fructivorans]MCT2873679.1 hypothetical protein [Fructilactobacillus fructivorans]